MRIENKEMVISIIISSAPYIQMRNKVRIENKEVINSSITFSAPNIQIKIRIGIRRFLAFTHKLQKESSTHVLNIELDLF